MAVSHEAEHSRHVINNLESSITIAKALRHAKSQYLDGVTKIDIDLTITSSEDVLHTVDRTIEGYRSDIQMKGAGHAQNRRDWLFRSHASPTNNGPTPASCLRYLTTHIERMKAIQAPPSSPLPVSEDKRTCVPLTLLPGYRDSLAPRTQGLRPPSLRKLRSKQSISKAGTFTFMANTSTLGIVAEKEADFPTNHGLNDDTSSCFSHDDRTTTFSSGTGDSSMSSTTSYISMSCTGRYCTLEYCGNHGRTGAANEDGGLPDMYSLTSDRGASDKVLISSLPTIRDPWNNAALRPPSRRKKGRSGFI